MQFLFKILLVVALFIAWGVPPGLAWADVASVPRSNTSIQPYLDQVIDRISEFRLDNGMKFIVLKRDRAPVVSFMLYADAGGANEPDGVTGVAHYLEHLAFKGTKQIGTKDYQAEKPLMDEMDALFDQIKAAEAAGDEAKVGQLTSRFNQVQAEAATYVNQNEFAKIVEQEGGIGMNATTSADATRYFYSLPANKLELWMSLESERFLDPVFREFYKEKQVILEERRLRTENSPVGQMIEALLDEAFQVHPYRRPVIGYTKDLKAMTRENVGDFFSAFYVPNNLTAVIVGDIDPTQVKQLAETYFGRYPAQSEPPKLTKVEPRQDKAREVTLELQSQPWYFETYHRPEFNHPDHVVYQAIANILSSGRTARLYKSMVEEQQIALAAEGLNSFPGNKYPTLMLFYALTAPGHTVDEVAAALDQEIQRLTTELVSQEELDRVKTQARAGLLRSLSSNMGMASALAEYQVKTGSWKNLFQELDAISEITPADIQRVAKATFRPENRTIGKILPKES